MPSKPKTYAQARGGVRTRGERPRHTIAAKIRSTARWTKFVAWHKRAFPLCCDPLGRHKRDGQVVAAQARHHIVPINEAPELAFALSNVAPVCDACHAIVEGKDGELWDEWRAVAAEY